MKRPMDMNERLFSGGKPVLVDGKPAYKMPDPLDHAYSDNDGECWYCGGALNEHKNHVDCSDGERQVK
jgi:hypothetical protein